VQQVAGSIVNALKPPQTAGSSKLAAPKMPVPKPKVHSSGDIIFLVVVIAIAIVIGIDSSRRHGISAAPTCTSSYAACFENLKRLPLKNGQSLDTQQFDEMLDAIHDDLKGGWRTPFDPARMNYDTPFWDGNPRFGQKIYDDEVVCLDGKCSPRSAVNYVAQGMYSARTNQSLEAAKGIAQWWNRIMYFHDATDDELYWLEYGYNAEKERAQDVTQP
jgi:hypothetical protein